MEKTCLKAALVMVVLAILLRLSANGVLQRFLEDPRVVSFVVMAHTGRYVNREKGEQETVPPTTTPTTPTEPVPEEIEEGTEEEDTDPPTYTAFGAADAALVEVNSYCGYEVDIATLLQKPLVWELTGDKPTVLILHSHGSESYKNTENYIQTSDFRTLSRDYNMVSVGLRLAEKLEAQGIRVVHDTVLHDYPSYNQAYTQARKSIKTYLEKYPSVRLVLDLHRDAVTRADGSQAAYTVKVDGNKVARMMLVVGTDASGKNHPNWQENMAMAVKLHAQLEKQAAGICRPISFRRQRFNQDLSKGAVIVEVGATGNTRQEALLAAEVLAEGIAALAHGTAGDMH